MSYCPRRFRFEMLCAAVILAGWAGISCSAPPPKAPVLDPAVEAKIEAEIQAAQRARDRYEAALEEHREQCGISDGECLVELEDQAQQLRRDHYTPRCIDDDDPEAELDCLTSMLRQEGNAQPLDDYYLQSRRCYQKLVQCVSGLEEQDADQRRARRVAQRLQAIEQSAEGIEHRAHVSYMLERIVFLRATLPPAGDELCIPGEARAACDLAVVDKRTQLEDELSKSEGRYDPRVARVLFAEAERAEASCYDEEFKCLDVNLIRFAEFADSRPLLRKNLDLLEERARLAARLEVSEGEQCVMQGLNEFQPKILENYRTYVGQPVLFFRKKLHRAFMELHQAQVGCLEQAVANHPTPRRSAPAIESQEPRFGG